MSGRRLGVLLSGSGRTLENLFERIADGSLRAEVALVMSSKASALGLERAAKRGVPTAVVEPARGQSAADYSRALFERLREARVDLVVLAGFLRVIEVPPDFAGRILNIHPALLPAFGGAGMWGHHVHEAVLASGVRTSGCTVHYVTNEIDGGPIVLQRSCEVREDDTPDSLAARVFEEEKRAYPEAIALHLDGRLRIEGGVVRRAPGAAPSSPDVHDERGGRGA